MVYFYAVLYVSLSIIVVWDSTVPYLISTALKVHKMNHLKYVTCKTKNTVRPQKVIDKKYNEMNDMNKTYFQNIIFWFVI